MTTNSNKSRCIRELKRYFKSNKKVKYWKFSKYITLFKISCNTDQCNL